MVMTGNAVHLTETEIKQMATLRKQGEPFDRIANRYGISARTVRRRVGEYQSKMEEQPCATTGE